MSVYYPVSRIEECLPTEYGDDWSDDTSFEKPRILNLAFYKLLGSAIEQGSVKIYSAAGRLLSPNVLGNSLNQYLNQKEFNLWLEENRLAYSWRPKKLKTTTLSELKNSGELRTDCLDVVSNLKARGFPPERIDKQKVAKELSQRIKYKNNTEGTIFHRIRHCW